jgi:hypothetical protein
VSKAGGVPSEINDTITGDLAEGGGKLFATSHAGGPLVQLDLDGTNPVTIADGTKSSRAAFDGGTLYWTNSADPEAATTGSVAKATIPGGSPTPITSTTKPAVGIAVGVGAIFFTLDDTDGSIWAAPK